MNAIVWMKSNNHLTLIYPTIYECEEIKGEIDKIDPKNWFKEESSCLLIRS